MFIKFNDNTTDFEWLQNFNLNVEKLFKVFIKIDYSENSNKKRKLIKGKEEIIIKELNLK
jgi:hypothetical protein